jgi:glycosyltransferase involved in cell wall biosynthesis
MTATSASPGSSRAPRVLVLSENLSVPFDTRVWKEARTLASAGYDVQVVCPRGSTRDTEPYAEIENVRIHRYSCAPAAGGPLSYLREYGVALGQSVRLTLRLAREAPFDVVHACNPPDLFFLIGLMLKPAGTRFLFDHHDLVPELFLSRFADGPRLLYRLSLWLERLTFALADGVISTNESYRRAATGRGKVPPGRVSIVRSAPDLSRFTPVEPDPSLKGGKPYLACYLGVMGPQDGVDYALRALAHLRHDRGRDDLRSVFIGSGDAFDESVALSRALELDDCVEFTGRVSDSAVLRYLSTADVCISPDPSNPLNDVSSMNKVVEYMAMSRPFVSFDLAEARFTAQDAALYAFDNDEREFARLIGVLLDDPERRERMGRLGRLRVEESFSWEISARNLLAAYADLLGRPPRRSWRRWLRRRPLFRRRSPAQLRVSSRAASGSARARPPGAGRPVP